MDKEGEQNRISQLYAENKAAFEAAQEGANKGEFQYFEKSPTNKAGEQPTITQALKPCPFCGEHCAVLAVDQGDKWAHYEPSCLEVRTGYDLGDNAPWRAELSAAWNTRANQPILRGWLVEALGVHLYEHSMSKALGDAKLVSWSDETKAFWIERAKAALSAIKGDKA